MPRSDYNPSLVHLALHYGTITKAQFKQLSALLSGSEKSTGKEAELLLKQGLATRYQIGLLKLIQDYQVIRRKGEEFGKLAVKKGFASAKDIKSALEIQHKAFRETRLKKLIGDILVETKIITAEQKLVILREQTLLAEKTRKILAMEPEGPTVSDDDVDLSRYEKEFLKIKALDQDFSAALLEKGLVSEEEILRASAIQEEAFEEENAIKIIGDIMVDLEMISSEQREIILREQGRVSDHLTEPKIHIEVSSDKMSAWAYLPPDDSQITIRDLQTAADTAGIIEGKFADVILQAGLNAGLKAIPVARQDYSKVLRDSQELVSYLDTDDSDNKGKKKGDVLVVFQSTPQPGSYKNILGGFSETFSDKDFTIRCGAGTRLSRDKSKILAMKTGVPALSLQRDLYIHPTVHVLEDVDLRYGPTEAYANLVVSGTVTGAYPIKAGSIKAREIRGGRIEAIGDIHSDVGITDAVIRCQGDITARYLHNCTLEIFGNLYVKNEIFDSDIRCAGKIDSPTCRAVSSYLSAKQGVVLAGLGSDRTRPCRVVAGTEEHLILHVERILSEIESVRRTVTRFDEKIEEVQRKTRKTFEKMVELKIFHDRAKKTKLMLAKEFKTKGQAYTEEKMKNLKNLMVNFDGRMEKSIQSLKELNRLKKKYDQSAGTLMEKKEGILPKVERQILKLEQTLFAYMEWARHQPGIPKFDIRGKVCQGTIFKGVWAEKKIMSDLDSAVLQEERSASTKEPEIRIL